jgi:hypothetical protein
MAIGDVQQADVAERLQRIVQVFAVRRAGHTDRQSGGSGGGEPLQEFTPLHQSLPAIRSVGGEPRRRVGFTG